jgi:hypothetical protein
MGGTFPIRIVSLTKPFNLTRPRLREAYFDKMCWDVPAIGMSTTCEIFPVSLQDISRRETYHKLALFLMLSMFSLDFENLIFIQKVE